jgi:hypothetical protein
VTQAPKPTKQNLTVSLDKETIRKAKVLAAVRGASISQLLAHYIERMVEDEESYERAQQRALAHLEQGFPLGGTIRATRDEWHER